MLRVMIAQKAEGMFLLLCVDGSDNADRAASFISRLASCTNIRVTLLHVMTEKEVLELSKEEEERLAESRMKRAKSQLGEAAVEFTELVQIGEAEEVILEISNKHHAIVMGYKGHGWLESLIMGSVSEKVLRESKIPVILVP
jgi:nucleotide-binding universal stress UspA family protein